MTISRRTLLASMACLPAVAAPTWKIVVAGGHPGDPECGCGGAIARYTEQGHDVTLLYLNRGEGYCGGAALDRCAGIRTAEAEKACRILKARAVFAGQVDGKAVVDAARYDEFRRVLDAEKADVIFTHWPIDEHRDHRAISLLTLDAWMKGGRKPALYFYEVADDARMFTPTEFVDISAVEAQRRAACFAHASQQPAKWYPKQTELTRMRGEASGFAQAEGFVRHWQSRRGELP
jgi:LmbE family N-acetylglucosaminyl deacetylase